MRGLAWILVAALAAACACKQGGSEEVTGPGTGTGSGTGTGTGTGVTPKPGACDQLEAHVGALYQAGAERTKMTPEEIADSTAMVLGECRAAPDRVGGCAKAATSIAQLEACLAPLDDDGSEGLQFQNK